jgi:hypothetical protein
METDWEHKLHFLGSVPNRWLIPKAALAEYGYKFVDIIGKKQKQSRTIRMLIETKLIFIQPNYIEEFPFA